MSYYRLYSRRASPSGPIIGVEVIHADDDAKAMEVARFNPADFVELWQQGRRVAIVSAKGDKA